MHRSCKEMADLICRADEVLSPKKWLSEEVADLATRIPNLDEIPPSAILPLAKLVVGGESDAKRLASSLGMDEVQLNEYLDALCEFKFAEESSAGYRATPAGELAFDAIGKQMVIRVRFEVGGMLSELDRLNALLFDS